MLKRNQPMLLERMEKCNLRPMLLNIVNTMDLMV